MFEPAADLPESVRERVAAYGGVQLVLLFGSCARGSANPESDVDLAIDADPSVDRGLLAGELSRALGREVDIVELRGASIPLLEELVREAVTIYERRPGAAARWRARTLCDLELDRTWYARMRDAWLERVARKGVLDGQP